MDINIREISKKEISAKVWGDNHCLQNHGYFTTSLYAGGDVGVEYVLYAEYGGASVEYVDVTLGLENCPGYRFEFCCSWNP